MSRLAVLRRHRMRTIGGLAVVLAAVGVAVGSGASFTSTSANPSTVFTAGTLHHTNTGGGVLATATITNITPGWGTTDGTAVDTTPSGPSFGTMTIHNDGSLPGDFTVSPSGSGTAYSGPLTPASVCGGTCSPLDGALRVRIDAVDDSGTTTVYNGLVSGLGAAHLGDGTVDTFSLAADATRTYNAMFYLPQATGNAFQGGSATLSIAFNEAQQ
jgi:spore coat-associated protein N